ncbi:MAG: DUF2344 domain-containing protein [Eisenbergiella sp.]
MIFWQDSIIVIKETKKGTSQMDIRPGIYECKVTPEGILAFTVDASSGGNIKPALLLGALWKFAGMQAGASFLGNPADTYGNLYQYRHTGTAGFCISGRSG